MRNSEYKRLLTLAGALVVACSVSCSPSKIDVEQDTRVDAGPEIFFIDAGDRSFRPPEMRCSEPDGEECLLPAQTIDWWLYRAWVKGWDVFSMHLRDAHEVHVTDEPEPGVFYDITSIDANIVVEDVVLGNNSIWAGKSIPTRFARRGCYEPRYSSSYDGGPAIAQCFDSYRGKDVESGASLLVFRSALFSYAWIYTLDANAVRAQEANRARDLSLDDLKRIVASFEDGSYREQE